MEQFQFEKLTVWNESCRLVVDVYKLLGKFPKHEQYALCDQIRRAVVSVPSNIAEGNGRMAIKEQIHFLEISFGSLMEVYTQLKLSVDLEYITPDDFKEVRGKIYDISKMISGLRASKVAKL